MPSRRSTVPELRMVEVSCGWTSDLHGLPDDSPRDNNPGGGCPGHGEAVRQPAPSLPENHERLGRIEVPRTLESAAAPARPHRTLCDLGERPAGENHMNGPPCGPKEKAMKKHSSVWITKAAAL